MSGAVEGDWKVAGHIRDMPDEFLIALSFATRPAGTLNDARTELTRRAAIRLLSHTRKGVE